MIVMYISAQNRLTVFSLKSKEFKSAGIFSLNLLWFLRYIEPNFSVCDKNAISLCGKIILFFVLFETLWTALKLCVYSIKFMISGHCLIYLFIHKRCPQIAGTIKFGVFEIFFSKKADFRLFSQSKELTHAYSATQLLTQWYCRNRLFVQNLYGNCGNASIPHS